MDLAQHLELDEVRFIPAADPPHRDTPIVGAEHRAAMVERAISGIEGFSCDRRELARQGPSYTVDTLAELREELGDEASLCLVMGSDAAAGLATWHRWKELANLAHIVIQARAGWSLPTDDEVGQYLAPRLVEPAALWEKPAGLATQVTLRQLEISATEIRALLQSGQSARFLLPESVLTYIEDQGLYGAGI